MDIQDKVVIITGSSAGIGLATAKLFAQRGAKVVLAARSTAKLQQIAGELRSLLAQHRSPCSLLLQSGLIVLASGAFSITL